MAEIQNAYGSDLTLPDGTTIKKGEAAQTDRVNDWEGMKVHPVVSSWLATGFLVETGAEAAASTDGEGQDGGAPSNAAGNEGGATGDGDGDGADQSAAAPTANADADGNNTGAETPSDEEERAAITAEIEALGGKVDGRHGTDRLREQLEKLKASA